jgi:uncharacterized membrane protein
MLRYLAPYLTALAVIVIACAVGYSTGVIDAAGLYGLLFAGLLIVAVGGARWEQRHPHRQ